MVGQVWNSFLCTRGFTLQLYTPTVQIRMVAGLSLWGRKKRFDVPHCCHEIVNSVWCPAWQPTIKCQTYGLYNEVGPQTSIWTEFTGGSKPGIYLKLNLSEDAM